MLGKFKFGSGAQGAEADDVREGAVVVLGASVAKPHKFPKTDVFVRFWDDDVTPAPPGC